jgi:hypothetical protein
MSLLIFCPAPYRYPLKQSPPRRWQRSSGFRRNGLRAKPLRKNAMFAWRSFLKLAFHQTGVQRLAGDVSTGFFRPVVPLKFRKDIFSHFHNVAHPRKIVSSRFVWCGLSSDITAWTHECLTCQWCRVISTPAWPPSQSPSHSDVFLTFMLIWWDPYSTVTVLIIFYCN